MVVREYICVDFSKNNEDYLFAGSSSGDFVAIQLKSKTLSQIVPVASQGAFFTLRSDGHPVRLAGAADRGVWRRHARHLLLRRQQVPDDQAHPAFRHGQLARLESAGQKLTQESILATNLGFIFRTANANLALRLICENHTNAITYLTYPRGASDRFASCSDVQQNNLGRDYKTVERERVHLRVPGKYFEVVRGAGRGLAAVLQLQRGGADLGVAGRQDPHGLLKYFST